MSSLQDVAQSSKLKAQSRSLTLSPGASWGHPTSANQLEGSYLASANNTFLHISSLELKVRGPHWTMMHGWVPMYLVLK